MPKNKDWRASFFGRLLKPKQQGSLIESTVTPTSAPAEVGSSRTEERNSLPVEPGTADTVGSLAKSIDVVANDQAGGQQSPSTAPGITTVTGPSDQKESDFSAALTMLLPRDVVKTMQESNKDSFMDKVKEAGESTWTVFKKVLKAVEAVSDSHPPLQLAVKGLLKVLEQVEIMEDAQEDLFFVSQKMAALERILSSYSTSEIPKHVERRMQGVQEWMETLTMSINAQNSRHWMNRAFHADEDRKKVAELLRSFTSVLDLYMVDASIATEGALGNIEAKIDELTDIHLLEKLIHVADASYIAQDGDYCLKGTRYTVMTKILDWCNNPSGPSVYWLCGMAGTGKSAIARTVCRELKSLGLLGGSFFCSRRATAEEQDIRRIIPTIAWQLSHRGVSTDYVKKLVDRLKEDSDIVRATIEMQLGELIVEPSRGSFFSKPLILVIDALDEGARADQASQLLKAILQEGALADIPLRIFVTSRPEKHIRDQFWSDVDASEHTSFHLQDIEDTIARADIHLYIVHRLKKIKADSRLGLSDSWPEEEQIEKLVNRADKLFIYAFTACNYIQGNPYKGLNRIVEVAGSEDQPIIERLDEMYMLILNEATNRKHIASDIASIIRKCLIVMIFAQETFTFSQLAAFIGVNTRIIENAIGQLHSLVLVPSSEDGELTTLHASFGDYLKNENRSGKHFITENEARLLLLQCCFRTMKSQLRFNVADAQTSFLRNAEQGLVVSQPLLYAATRWSEHVMQNGSSEQPNAILGWIQDTLVPKFLFWLEVISISGRVSEAQKMLETLLPFVENMQDLIKFINDAIYFVHQSQEAISQSVPHIYLSALPLAWRGSLIREKFYLDDGRTARMNFVGAERSKRWDLCLVDRLSIYVLSVAISPDGTRIASGSSNGIVRIWDSRTGYPIIEPLQGHNGWVISVTFSPDGTWIASGSDDKKVRLWDAKSGQSIRDPFNGHTDIVNSVAFSPDGTRIVSGSNDHTVRIWSIETGQSAIDPLQGHTDCVTSVAFSPDSTLIISGSYDNTVRIWHAKTGQPVMKPLQGHTDAVRSVAFSPNGARIVSGSADGTVRMWDVKTGHPVIRPLQEHTHSVLSVNFSPDGTRIVSGSTDNMVHVCDAETGQRVMDPLQGHTDWVRSVTFSPDNACIISASDDGTVRLWNTKVITTRSTIQSLQGHFNYVFSVAFSPDGTCIASGSTDCTVCLWSTKSGQPIIKPLLGHASTVISVAFSLDGTLIVSGSADNTVRIWNARTGCSIMDPLKGHTDCVNSVAFSPDGTCIVSGSDDKTVRIWDARTGQPVIEPLQGHTNAVRSVAFSPDGTCIVSGSNDLTVRLWNAKTGEPIMEPFQGHTGLVWSIAFSPDGACVASGSFDNTVRLWDVKSGQPVIKPLQGHTDNVRSVAFSPNGTYIVSGSDDCTVRIWNAKTGQLVMEPLRGHASSVFSVAFSPDGTRIVSGSGDHAVRVWDARTIRPTQPSSRYLLGAVDQNPYLYISTDTGFGSGSNNERLYLWDLQTGLPDTLEQYISQEIGSSDVSLLSASETSMEAEDRKEADRYYVPENNPFLGLSQIPSFDSQPRLSETNNPFIIDQNGWIKGPNGELFIWIPEDLRSSLPYWPRTISVISRTKWSLDLSKFAYGTDWTSCRSSLRSNESNDCQALVLANTPSSSRGQA